MAGVIQVILILHPQPIVSPGIVSAHVQTMLKCDL